MRTVFVYEFFTARGQHRDPSDPAHSLWREGNAMRAACVADFERIPGVTVTTMLDISPQDDWTEFCRLAPKCDATLVIAAEIDSVLERRQRSAREAGARSVLGSAETATQIASDKRWLAEVWSSAGVPTPVTIPVEEVSANLPVVIKSPFGAGSHAIRRLDSLPEWESLRQGKRFYCYLVEGMLTQPYVPGVAASVSFLVGPNCVVPLLPGYQRIAGDGRFTYLGGEIPLPDGLTLRAVKLARRAIDAVPGLGGYVGVDLVLGDAADGSADYAIEINPRLTTSYVGLRALTDDNLMAKLWEVCDGAADVRVRWRDGGVRFTPDGTVTRFE